MNLISRGLKKYSLLQPVIVLARVSWSRMPRSDAALKGRYVWELEWRGTRSARCNASVGIPSTEKPLLERFLPFKQRPSKCKIIDSDAIFAFHTGNVRGSQLERKKKLFVKF